MANPEACVLIADGSNCDMEMMHAFEVAGADVERVHVNQLRSGQKRLGNYAILGFPGGFTYGDDIASGKVLANELTSYLSDQLLEFVAEEKPVIGPCNGMQVLMQSGLLPFGTLGEQQATMAQNDSGRFECRWINLVVEDSMCLFISPDDFEETPLPMQVAHGEGKFFAEEDELQSVITNKQVVLRYATADGEEAASYPDNPNGSLDNIAGICDPTGLILGLMPHPERSIEAFHPHRTRTESARLAGRTIFNNIVNFAKEG